jgi:hypothetical protein
MSQSTTRFTIRTPDGQPVLPDSPVTPQGDLPAEVAGQPASYFWKDMIHAGNYLHPAGNLSLAVDRQRLGNWADVGQRMLAAGVAIPINCDHSDSARDVVGYVQQFKLEDDRLLGLCQFIGDEAALTAARNLVSVGIDPDFTDGQGRQWGEAIVHLALTPVPVVPDQDQFVQAGSDAEEEPGVALACTAGQLETLRGLIGSDFSREDGVEQIIQLLQTRNADERATGVEAELASARQRILQLSARLPPALPRDAEVALVESATAKFDAAVSRGSLSPAARDGLVAILVQDGEGKANLMTLSRAANSTGDRALALAVADILLENDPIELGERTGLQAMARTVPGQDGSSIEQLRQYMTKMASVSG